MAADLAIPLSTQDRRTKMIVESDCGRNASDTQIGRREFLGVVGVAATAAVGLAAPMRKAVAATKQSSTAASPTHLPWPERGTFGGKVIVGPHRANAAAMVSREPLMGLPREMTFIYGGLRDGDGNLIEVVRIMHDRPNPNNGLFVQENAGKDTLHAVPDVMQAAASALGFESEIRAEEGVWRSKPGIPGKPFEITMTADGSAVMWREEGVLDVHGTLLGPGLQWYSGDREGNELYVSQIYLLEGTYKGRSVRGIVGFDQSYLPESQDMYSGKDPLFRAQIHHRCWYTWGTVYKDGGYDCGHFVLGTDRLGFALYTNQRHEVTMVSDVTGEISIEPAGTWPARITVGAAGTGWEFLPDPRGRMPDMLGGAAQSWTPQNEGRWRRIVAPTKVTYDDMSLSRTNSCSVSAYSREATPPINVTVKSVRRSRNARAARSSSSWFLTS